jgi:hypothetical protein
MRQSDGGPSLVRWQTQRGGEKLEVGLDVVEGGGAHTPFIGRGGVELNGAFNGFNGRQFQSIKGSRRSNG